MESLNGSADSPVVSHDPPSLRRLREAIGSTLLQIAVAVVLWESGRMAQTRRAQRMSVRRPKYAEVFALPIVG